MSIIYEALKKSEGINNKSETRAIKKAKGLSAVYIVAGVVAIAGILIANFIFGVLAKPAQIKTVNLPVKIPSVGQSVQQAKVLPRQDAPSSLPSLALSGIFFSEDQGYALINNKIVKEGDIIDGAVLLKVSLNDVELKSQDTDTTIKLSLNSN